MDFPRDSCNRGRPVPSVALDVRAIISHSLVRSRYPTRRLFQSAYL